MIPNGIKGECMTKEIKEYQTIKRALKDALRTARICKETSNISEYNAQKRFIRQYYNLRHQNITILKGVRL